MGKLPLRTLVVVILVVLAYWLWPGGEPDEEIPESAAAQRVGFNAVTGSLVATNERDDKQETRVAQIERKSLNEPQSRDLETRFKLANETLSAGERESAAEEFKLLTQDYPNFVEPYVNLAAVQAELGELEDARETLIEASNANQSTKVLFDSIKRVHGALAAQSYRQALEASDASEVAVSLPKVSTLSTDFSQAGKISELNSLLEEQRSNAVAFNDGAAELEIVKAQLAEFKARNEAFVSEQEVELSSLNQKLSTALEQSRIYKAQLDESRKITELADSDLVAKLRIELGSKESALQDSQNKINELVLANADLSNQVKQAQQATEPPVIVASNVVTQQPSATAAQSLEPQLTNGRREIAISLVKAWARAWSTQDVKSYVSFYKSGYRPNNSVTHQQWLDQRQVRLTNKRFIEVKVRDFSVDVDGAKFNVSFTQHYRSNTLDDTIRKQLTFSVPNGGDWANAKVTRERIVKR